MRPSQAQAGWSLRFRFKNFQTFQSFKPSTLERKRSDLKGMIIAPASVLTRKFATKFNRHPDCRSRGDDA
jgi:hypothetical protein